uniref:Uncharacterized protein n=1 Tax=uncultured prokaryote TaxID=198431 RepID=A0A0H5PXA5_9ZZZZ|nr:hypothetical protein [uncultured prokaryote]
MIKLRDSQKREVLKDFLSNVKMLKYEWEDLQEHSKTQIKKIVGFHQEVLNDDLREWVAFYICLERISQIKLRNFK